MRRRARARVDRRGVVRRGALRALTCDAGEVPRGFVFLGPQMVKGQAVGDLVGACVSARILAERRAARGDVEGAGL